MGSFFIAGGCLPAITFAQLLKPLTEDIELDRVRACAEEEGCLQRVHDTPSDTPPGSDWLF